MRKKTIKNLFDNIFWYIIYLLPLILLFFAWYTGNTDMTLNTLFMVIDENLGIGLGFNVLLDNPFVMGLASVFLEGGVFPLFQDPGIVLYLGYFMSCWVLHLFVDVLLFIVRWSHSMIDGFLGGKHD